jgi:hypothetical protein
MSNGLHLYRLLLRKCTYLPDSVARQWCSQYISARFRRHQIDKAGSTWRHLTPQRQRKAYRDARIGAHTLGRANAGHMKSLAKVLSYTYGRTGPRRREIISQLIRPDVPSDQNAVLQLRDHATTDHGPGFSSRVLALMDAQKNRQFINNRIPNLRHTAPDIPELNIWERPMPRCRVKNQLKKFKAKTYGRLLAPLPDQEWFHLYGLVTGKRKWNGIIPRRKKIGIDTVMVEETTLASTILEQRKPRKRPARQDTPHTFTARYMQRHWKRILSHTPRLVFDDVQNRWMVKWYDPGDVGIPSVEAPQPAAQLPESDSTSTLDSTASKVFAGVDKDGRLIAQM